MPNLVGIGNSQIPTNAMLGGLAYQDSVGEINIEKIKARTGDTAVDIFVYDTRKDSDGGAWRHRTQNLSWYNEGANAFRGARKEFPAVAVIVSTSSNTIIYDGDDPNLSMWMEFSGSAGWLGGAAPAALSAKNGIITVGSNTTNQRLRLVFLLKDYCEDWAHVAGGGHRASKGNFLVRNSDSPAGRTLDSTIGIVNRTINGVAMTVLPNAPIDASTGLPVPTIAIATDGGTNIIQDDGVVAQGYQTIATENVDLHPDGFMTDGISGATNDSFSLYNINLNERERIGTYGHRAGTHPYNTFLNEATGECLFEGRSNKLAIAQSLGLLRIEEQFSGNGSIGISTAGGLHNKTTSSYNTGWMPNNLKGVYLSDTTAETMSKSSNTELLTNGSDWTGASGTTAPNGWTSFGHAESAFTIDSGRLKIGNGAANNATALHQNVTTVVGTTYTLYFDYERHSSAQYVIVRVGTSTLNGSLGYFYGSSTSSTSGSITFVATTTSTNISVQMQSSSGNAYVYVDSMSVKAVGAADRSALSHVPLGQNGANGLALYGSLTKTAVATGAELVYYSGFSDTDFLLQPYNSALNFGTGDLYIMFWAYFTQDDAYDLLMARRAHNGSAYTGNGWYLEMGASNNITLKDSVSNASRAVMDGDSTHSVWQHICFVRRNNVGYSYKNGVQGSATTPAWTENLDNTSLVNSLYTATLTIGRGTISGHGDADKTRLALVRIGATAPSEEQIKKIYNDEKCLYHENAKCTLYGTSSAVTALAHDDTNDTLHVGTSGGRSDFRGLNRINNTTTAVTAAISASNGLVAEQ